MGAVKENVERVRERIERAALKVGRSPEEVTLVAAAKGVDASRVREAVEAGVEVIGENYVQEAKRKKEEVGEGIRWHMIGHLQSNKARHAVELFEMIHSLDSLRLAQELDRRAAQRGKVMKVLLQVNLSGEETKSGISEEEIWDLAEGVLSLKHLSLEGLMTMPPFFPDPEEVRPFFKRLRELREEMQRRGISLKELSMGMSTDFEVAVEEGATMVRVGRAIFGERR